MYHEIFQVEILLDMLAQKTAETSLQVFKNQGNVYNIYNFKQMQFPLQDSEILRLRENLDMEALNCQPVRLV